MEAPNIKLYELFRRDLHLSDDKSLELMNILDSEFKGGIKADLAALGQQLNGRFDKIDARFEKVDARFDKMDARFTAQDKSIAELDKKIDILEGKVEVKISDLRGDLRTEILSAKNETNRYILSLFLAILLSFLALFLKK